MFNELRSLESQREVTEVGAPVKKKRETHKHTTRMLSLGNAFDAKDLLDFDKRCQKALCKDEIIYSIEWKYDGLAISVHYNNGNVKKMVTRGDGSTGEDVTHNIKYVNLPKSVVCPHFEATLIKAGNSGC